MNGRANMEANNCVPEGLKIFISGGKKMLENAVARALKFERREVYHSAKKPGYACWVSFFPGENGQWYIAFDEVSYPDKPLPKISRNRWYWFNMPNGYDKSQYLLEMVIIESKDDMKTWNVISREPIRNQHASHIFASARTKDGSFLRFVWKYFSIDENVHPGEIFSVSNDNGKTWAQQPAFHDKRFASAPHRLRMLRDGTLVLAIPFLHGPVSGQTRTSVNLNANGTTQMNLCFSYDQGKTWTTPMPIYGSQIVTETDFVELSSGDLLCINNQIFPIPGQQIIYRTEKGFVPAPFEKSATPESVPETVCITEDDLLIGCHRSKNNKNKYTVSDDLGYSWTPVAGIPEYENSENELYQPWIQYLGNGRVACAGHYGYCEPILNRTYTQYLLMHLFELEVLKRTKNTNIDIVRDYDEILNRWSNSYTVTLTSDNEPLAGKDLELWYAEKYTTEYDDSNRLTLDERMKLGGKFIYVKTGGEGKAKFYLPHLDKIDDVHHSIKMIVRFNADRSDPDYKPAQSMQNEFYSIYRQDPPLELHNS